MNGVLVVDKPSGPTSHDVVDRVRQALGVRRVGHTGTLDPFATGVLAVCIGKATRLVRFLADGEKVYRATIRLGFATTTDDLLGEPLGPARSARVDLAGVKAACRSLVGAIQQVPPAYSAKRIAGQRSYYLARQGVAVERAAVPVVVHSFEILGIQHDEVEVEVRCSTGTYIRALARDLGEALGVGGHLVALRRTRNGDFGHEDAVPWDAIGPRAGERLLPLSRLLPAIPSVSVGPDGVSALRHGRDIERKMVVAGFPESPPALLRVLDESGALVALAVPRGFDASPSGPPVAPTLHPDVVLVD